MIEDDVSFKCMMPKPNWDKASYYSVLLLNILLKLGAVSMTCSAKATTLAWADLYKSVLRTAAGYGIINVFKTKHSHEP